MKPHQSLATQSCTPILSALVGFRVSRFPQSCIALVDCCICIETSGEIYVDTKAAHAI